MMYRNTLTLQACIIKDDVARMVPAPPYRTIPGWSRGGCWSLGDGSIAAFDVIGAIGRHLGDVAVDLIHNVRAARSCSAQFAIQYAYSAVVDVVDVASASVLAAMSRRNLPITRPAERDDTKIAPTPFFIIFHRMA